MKTGLLWFDNDPKRTLEEKVLRAAVHYEHKHDHLPSLCFVHPSAFDGRKPPCHAGGVEIRPGHSVLPDHFWLGAAGEADQ
jgi:hypothetical protein